MDIQQHIAERAIAGASALYEVSLDAKDLVISETKQEIEGDYTLVVFPLVRHSKKSPEATAEQLGEWICGDSDHLDSYSVVKGFLNFTLAPGSWSTILVDLLDTDLDAPSGIQSKALVEFSSPNTNKPLHLGHVRNILLGWSMTKILEATGHEVVTTQIANDRGIAICKSMVAWRQFADGATPESTGTKGDHFVGNYYVRFEKEFAQEYLDWQSSEEASALLSSQSADAQADPAKYWKDYKNQYFNQHSTLGAQAKEMLLRWEADDSATRDLWRQMNGWVYSGFDQTYETMGVSFDQIYYESDTYLLGKEIVAEGLDRGIFYRKDDGSVWVDLTDEGLDHKIVLRSDGTSVYITQDLGTAEQRYTDHAAKRMIYTVANEQDYHFQVLFAILKKFDKPYADGLYHLSYGMVDLPTGRMKTREGTVVDADDLIEEIKQAVIKNSEEKGGLHELDASQRSDIQHRIAMAAIKFFILKVNAKKRMIFDPSESVDLHGHTGPYVQNAYVRIQSILRRYGTETLSAVSADYALLDIEKRLLMTISSWKDTLTAAARTYDPSLIANFSYQLAKEYHRFYHDAPILKATDEEKGFRVRLSQMVAKYLAYSFELLGIDMPDRM